MVDYLGLFIGGLILFSVEVYVWAKFYDEKINFKNPLVYISILLMTFVSILNHLFVNAFISILVISFFIFFCNWLIFRRKINEIFVMIILGQFLVVLSEHIFSFLYFFVSNHNISFLKKIFIDTFFGNFLISLIYFCICSLPFVKKVYDRLVLYTEKIKFKVLIFFWFLLILSFNFFAAVVYYDMKAVYKIIINTSMLLVYSYIVYKAMNERNQNMITIAENKSLMESLNEYENMVDRQRVDNHENKNQLLIIRNMIKKKDKDVVEYIDTIINDEKEDDEALYTRVKTIPSGGLQGIIYQKMLTMKDEKILFSLDVSRDVRKIDLSNFSMENNYKLCKIIGVILDNAIEECRNIEEKIVMISLYIEDDMFVVDISNKFGGEVDVDKIDNEGYTTKGNGHGYGLSLVKKLVDESKGIFINERRVKNNVFKQVIKVKI